MQNLDFSVECHLSESLETIDKRYVAHSQYEMFLLLDGDVTMLINSKKYRITNGALVLLTSKDLHISINNVSTVYRRITIMFDHRVMHLFNTNQTNLLNCFAHTPSGEGNIIYLTDEQIALFVQYAQRIMPCCGSAQYGDDLAAISALITLLINVNKFYRKQKNQTFSELTSPVIQTLIDYIDGHIDEELTIRQLCQMVSYSESYISALFSQQMGVTLKRFILTKKIAYAKQLLAESGTILAVSEKCGFNDYSSFCRVFKQVTGVSPRTWKKEHDDAPVGSLVAPRSE